MSLHPIEFQSSNKELSSFSGLNFFRNLIDRLQLPGELGKILPKKSRNHGLSSKKKFITGILAFIAGSECIDDLDWCGRDSAFSLLTGGEVPSTTMNDFLKSFSAKNIEDLGSLSLWLSNELRSMLYHNEKKILITMDATDSIQHGKKMEGVEFNYKKNFGLSSQNAFDQFGFCYGWELRNGACHTSVGAVPMIERVFKSLPKSKEKYFIADSGYESRDIFNALLINGVNFAICLKENSWRPLLEKNKYSLKWEKTRLEFFGTEECQVASCGYLMRDLYGKRPYLRVVFIRGKKINEDSGSSDAFNYYAIVTNMNELDMNDRKIVELYRQRSNAENFIKDMKYGLDFRHFPCGKLMKNRAWGMMGVFAYNLLRYAALKLFPGKGCFIKTTRRKIIYLACEVVSHARKTFFRFSKTIYKEVLRLEKIFTSVSNGFHRSS